ncbi:MAG: hypothetical protein ACM3L9_04140 [Deltaproteobacteria bacterium]
MPWRIFRILAGFAAASLVAAVIQVLFVVDAATVFATRDGAAASGLLVMMASAQTACFAAPFSLAGIALSERMALRHLALFGLGGGLIGLAGYVTAIGWAGGPASAFPLVALVTAGAAGGFVYRLVAGEPGWRP